MTKTNNASALDTLTARRAWFAEQIEQGQMTATAARELDAQVEAIDELIAVLSMD